MLQRIYATSVRLLRFRKIPFGLVKRNVAITVRWRSCDLYSTDPRVGPGLILWYRKGSIIRNENEDTSGLILRHGYDSCTPIIVSEKLFQISGHLRISKENMFGAMDGKARLSAKPMNCRGTCIYQSHQRSAIPLRYAGSAVCRSTSACLHGMISRPRLYSDDAHIFCTRTRCRRKSSGLTCATDARRSATHTVELATIR
jgi:threonyl-tRNA synthetase